MRYLIPQTELIKSLRTKCEATALMRVGRWLDIVQRIRDVRDRFRMNELTAANYEEVIALLWEKAKNDSIHVVEINKSESRFVTFNMNKEIN